jgi:hypothetical protein
MGFLKFLKNKDKQDSIPEPPKDDSEMPPAPPSLDSKPSSDIPPPPNKQELSTDSSMDNMEIPPPPTQASDSKPLPEFPDIKNEDHELPPPPQDLPEKPMEMEPQEMPEQHMDQEPMQPEQQPQDDDSQDSVGYFEEDSQEEPIVPQEPAHYDIQGPLFIKSDNFQQILGRIKTTKEHLKSQEDKLFEMSDTKAKEEKKIDLWKSKLEDIQRKLIYVDKALFER